MLIFTASTLGTKGMCAALMACLRLFDCCTIRRIVSKPPMSDFLPQTTYAYLGFLLFDRTALSTECLCVCAVRTTYCCRYVLLLL